MNYTKLSMFIFSIFSVFLFLGFVNSLEVCPAYFYTITNNTQISQYYCYSNACSNIPVGFKNYSDVPSEDKVACITRADYDSGKYKLIDGSNVSNRNVTITSATFQRGCNFQSIPMGQSIALCYESSDQVCLMYIIQTGLPYNTIFIKDKYKQGFDCTSKPFFDNLLIKANKSIPGYTPSPNSTSTDATLNLDDVKHGPLIASNVPVPGAEPGATTSSNIKNNDFSLDSLISKSNIGNFANLKKSEIVPVIINSESKFIDYTKVLTDYPYLMFANSSKYIEFYRSVLLPDNEKKDTKKFQNHYEYSETKCNIIESKKDKIEEFNIKDLGYDNTQYFNLRYTECGELNKNESEIKELLKSKLPANSNLFGTYFLVNVSNDVFSDAQENLLGKYIVVVVDEDAWSPDDIYYYIVGDAPKDNTEKKATTNVATIYDDADISSIPYGIKSDFCDSKNGKYYYTNLEYINFSYDLDSDIDCSAYSSSGHFCDAQQLAKYAKKTYTKTYDKNAIKNYLVSRLGEDLKFVTFYRTVKNDVIIHHYYAENGLPLTLDVTAIPQTIYMKVNSVKDINSFYIPSEYLELFLVKDGECPDKKGYEYTIGNQENLSSNSKCYVSVYDTLAVNAIKDINTYRLVYMVTPDFLNELFDPQVKQQEDSYDYIAPLTIPEIQYYLLLSLGEDPIDYGMDAVLLKPGNYKMEAFQQSSIDVTFDLRFPGPYPGVYLNLINKLDPYKIDSSYFFAFGGEIAHKIFSNPLYYLSLNPDYYTVTANRPISVGTINPRLLTSAKPGEIPTLTILTENSSNNEFNISYDGKTITIKAPKSLDSDIGMGTFKLLDILPQRNKLSGPVMCYINNLDKSLTAKAYKKSELLAYYDVRQNPNSIAKQVTYENGDRPVSYVNGAGVTVPVTDYKSCVVGTDADVCKKWFPDTKTIASTGTNTICNPACVGGEKCIKGSCVPADFPTTGES